MEKFLHAFNLVEGLGYKPLEKLHRYFSDWQYAWEKGKEQEYVRAGLSDGLSQKIVAARREVDAEREFEQLWEKDIVVMSQRSKEFPVLLKEIPSPPFLLYRKGAALLGGSQNVSIVGTRMPSAYGEKIALEISENVAGGGGIVVSGLAFGIDAIAHFGAVKSGKPTVAVLASALDHITPASHNSLANKILETGGTLLSEYAGRVSYKDNFLWRNRIISGLSKATIVIEAQKKSGALITAQHALEQNREVCALVGDITRPQALGCLKLINEGAYPIVDLDDLLIKLGFDPRQIRTLSFSKEEASIIHMLREKNSSTEELLQKIPLPVERMNILLTQLELKGAIRKNKALLWETQ